MKHIHIECTENEEIFHIKTGEVCMYVCVCIYIYIYIYIYGPDSVVGIATAYGLDGPGIESRWGRDFRTCPDRS